MITRTSFLHNDSTANPTTTMTKTTSSATDDATTTTTTTTAVIPATTQPQNGVAFTDIINQSTAAAAAAAVQPKTILIQNLTTVGIQKASPTIRTSLKINNGHQQQQQQQQQTSCVDRSRSTEINDGSNVAYRQSRVETAAAAQPTNESSSTELSTTDLQRAAAAGPGEEEEEEVDVEYEVKQYVIEEIESTATVVINQPQTVRDLLGKVTSNPLILGLVFLILAITLLCILAEREISLVWTLFAISMASLIVFGGMKM